MFLKSLEVRGFKSFADKTEFNFKNGVTAIVGPNGSGKSNISDAVRWVLGEQSVKTLRGGKMEDVIFAGTQYRKPVGLAQVSLTLDNSDKVLLTPYNEVTVTRRIFRSGETEYLINNNKCRLKDITNLFMDTGIGKEGYSLIGQGKIESVLSGRPEDRRVLIEEAAGIVKYKSRKGEAEKKLANTDENLVRIGDIISTYEERLEPLKIDREKALKFTELSNELKEKEVSLIVSKIKLIEDELKVFNEELEKRKADLNSKREELKNKREELKSVEEKLENLERKTTDKKLEYFTKKEDITRLNSNVELFNERISNLDKVIEKNKLKEYGLNNKIKDIHRKKEILEKELSIKKLEQEKIEKEILNLEEENKKLNLKISDFETEFRSLKNSELELLRKDSLLKNKITEIKGQIKNKLDRKDVIEKFIENNHNNININKASINALSLNIESKEREFKGLKNKISLNKQALFRLNSNLSKKENEYKSVSIIISKLEANKSMLEDFENQYEGYNKSLKNLMDRVNKNLTPHTDNIDVLGEVFSVPKGYEQAIEIALGASISNVITETEKVAKDLIEYLKDNKLGRLTFLPLNIINGKKVNIDSKIKNIDGYLGIASEIVKFNDKYTKIIDYVLGKTLVCSSMDSAFNIAKQTGYKYKIVTLEGEVLNSGGALTGGSIRGRNSNILSRRREIEEIEEKIIVEKNKIEDLTREITKINNERKVIDEYILNNTDKIHEIKIEVATDRNELANLENTIRKLKDTAIAYKGEEDNINLEISSLNNDLDEFKLKLKELENRNSSNKEREVKLEGILNKEKSDINDINDKLIEFKISKASINELIQGKINDLSRKDNELKESNEKIIEINNENKNSLEEIENAKAKIKESLSLIKEYTKRLEKLEEIFKEDEVLKVSFKEEFRKLDSLIGEIREIITKKEGEFNKREILKVRSEMQIENHLKKLNEEMNLTYEEAKNLSKPIDDMISFKESINLIKRKISSLGTVNLKAIEEYEEVKEKYEFMFTQEQDLEKAKEELISVIEEMTLKMKGIFKENFKILNQKFDETFKELFKGGTAELILGEGDELTANIEINVMPPGKKLQNINLMSGGEKVLSAIALLFGILKMKPTPFCILDEIEAALDDANVYRYAEFLERFSKRGIQFIVITHRKGTMEVSDVMYGITMEEKGVSKVVSVDLTK